MISDMPGAQGPRLTGNISGHAALGGVMSQAGQKTELVGEWAGGGMSPAAAGQAPASEVELAGLVAAAAEGSQQAWERLVSLYARRIYAAAVASLRDRDTAEEVAQSVMATIFEHISTGRYVERGQFESWLFRVTMNRVRDTARRAGRRRRRLALMPIKPVMTTPAPAAGTPALPDHDTHSVQRLRDAVALLPEQDREIISLRHHAGLGFAAIAQSLGQPLGTVLARHHRALRKLKDLLPPDADGGPER
jgi:RNA polymerase sigma-70 factor (ECF subfamily)